MKRTKVLALILLYSILTAAMLQGFKMITTLWTVAVIQETLQMCPKPKALFTENDFAYPETGHRNFTQQSMDISII